MRHRPLSNRTLCRLCAALLMMGGVAHGEASVDERIDWQVIAGGGGTGASASFRLSGTVGQAVAGPVVSATYRMNQGFWQAFEGDAPDCCLGSRGNANGDVGDVVNIVDMTYLVAYLFSGGVAPPCILEANVNGDSGETVNIVDMTYLVAYLFSAGPAPVSCP